MENKRGYNRYNITLEPLSCSRSEKDDVKIDINDLSFSGMGISTSETLSKGDKIELELTIPGDDIPMFIEGEVAWVNRKPDEDNVCQAGIRLSKINCHDKDRLARYLNSNFTSVEHNIFPE